MQPLLLRDAGLLKTAQYTAHGSTLEELELMDQDVIKDGNLITSRGAGTAIEFGLSLWSTCGKKKPKKSANPFTPSHWALGSTKAGKTRRSFTWMNLLR